MEVLDAKKLAAQSIPLQAILFVSTAVGVALGALVLFLGSAIALAFVPGGFLAAFAAMIATTAYSTQLVIAGVLAILLIPLGATLAAHLKLRDTAKFIVEESGATILPDSNRAGTVVAEMSRKAGLPGPPRYAILENAFNAFAMSASHDEALVLIGRPLQQVLAANEIKAIIAHELGHIAMGDSKRKLLAQGHQEFLVVFLGFSGLKRLFRAVFGLIGELALAAHSREREYWADAVGAYLTSPEDMVAALRKLENTKPPPVTQVEKRYAALMLRPTRTEWFSTHPSIDRRIEALLDGTYLRRLPVRAAAEIVPKAPEAPPLGSYDGI